MRLCYGLFLVFIAACGSGTSYSSPPPPPAAGPPPAPPPPPPPGTFSVNIQDYDYAPSSITITAGQSIRWTNTGAVLHSVTSDSVGAFSSAYLNGAGTDVYGQPTAGGTYTRKFSSAGTFPYHCGVHDYMKGTVVVTQ
jgi:plastocyanin